MPTQSYKHQIIYIPIIALSSKIEFFINSSLRGGVADKAIQKEQKDWIATLLAVARNDEKRVCKEVYYKRKYQLLLVIFCVRITPIKLRII
jgi:hypothetical protein